MSVAILPIRLGYMTPGPVSPKCLELYKGLAQAFFSDGEHRVVNSLQPIPIISEHSLLPTRVAELIVSAITKAIKLDGNIILDVGGPDESVLLKPTVVQGVNAAVSELLRQRDDLRIGLFVPIPLAKDDHAAAGLRATLDQHMQVRLLFGDGTHWGRFFQNKRIVAHDIAKLVENSKTPVIQVLRNKIVRRVGHYRLPSSGETYVNYYDGHQASSEIYILLRERLLSLVGDNQIQKIYFDTRLSQWFQGPVVQALVDTGLMGIASEITDKQPAPNLRSSQYLLLLPIVRTANSLRKLLVKGAAKEAAVPRVWALMSTHGHEETDGTRLVELKQAGHDAPTVRVDYAVRVGGTNEWLHKAWNSVGFTGTTPDQEDLATPFSPSIMWAMILEAGMVLEDVGPSGRDRLGFVPNYEEITKLNSAFIASKFQVVLERKFGSSLPEVSFLCPAERHAQKLADCLRDLAGFGTVRVKRDVIDFFARGGTLKGAQDIFSSEASDVDSRDAFHQLRSLTDVNEALPDYERPSLVLLDEFTFSGRTTTGMYNLAKAFGLNVLCAITLGHFGSEDRSQIPMDHFTFYKIDYQHCLAGVT